VAFPHIKLGIQVQIWLFLLPLKKRDYPYLLKMEILSNGKVRILSLEEGFFI